LLAVVAVELLLMIEALEVVVLEDIELPQGLQLLLVLH
jgi:hypothetical protein